MKVLVIAPHADDEVIGVGGTMARYAAEGHEVDLVVAALGTVNRRGAEVKATAEIRRHERGWVRSIAADPVVVRQTWLRAYEFTTDRGAQALNEFARAEDPFTKVGEMQISADVSSVIRASPDSFRVAWIERHYQGGRLTSTEHWTAILTIRLQPPRSAERLRANPLGIYVHALNWSEELVE